jgi:hypothetical protein
MQTLLLGRCGVSGSRFAIKVPRNATGGWGFKPTDVSKRKISHFRESARARSLSWINTAAEHIPNLDWWNERERVTGVISLPAAQRTGDMKRFKSLLPALAVLYFHRSII